MTDLNPYMPVPKGVCNGYDLLDASHYEQEIVDLMAQEDEGRREQEARRVKLVLRALHTKMVHAAEAIAGLMPQGPDRDIRYHTASIASQWRKADYIYWKEKHMPIGLLADVSFVWKVKNNNNETMGLFYDKATVSLPPQVGHLVDVGVPGVFFSVTSVVTATTDIKMPGDCVAIYSAPFSDEMISYLRDHLKEWSTPESSTEAAEVIKRFVPEWL